MDKHTDLMDKIIREIPLKTKVRTFLWFSFVDLITELGYREDTYWTDSDEDVRVGRIIDQQLTQATEGFMKMFKEWEEQQENVI